jgi:hypothetical protein
MPARSANSASGFWQTWALSILPTNCVWAIFAMFAMWANWFLPLGIFHIPLVLLRSPFSPLRIEVISAYEFSENAKPRAAKATMYSPVPDTVWRPISVGWVLEFLGATAGELQSLKN